MSKSKKAGIAGIAIIIVLLTVFLFLRKEPITAIQQKARDSDIETMIRQMSLRDKAAQMIVPSFRIWKAEGADESQAENVTELNNEIREMIQQDHFGGVLLNMENCRDPEQTLRLVADMQTANRDGGGIPMLIAIDQEGGNVANVGFATKGVSNMALAATGDPENAREMAYIHGKEIGLLGIQVDYAPVVDINNNPANPIIGIRAFSDKTDIVSKFGIAYLQGLHKAGTIATLKHFPGHGNTDTDSHTGFPIINSNYEELKQKELIPFQEAINAGADMVMTAHIQYPQIETETYTSVSTGEKVYLPATMSRTIMTGILREKMGFEGVIASDALEMAAIADHFQMEDVITMTVNAGVDMLLPPTVKNYEQFRMTQTMLDMLISLVENGKIEESRIDDAVRRILTLKEKYGVLQTTDFTVTEEKIKAATNGIAREENRAKEREIAEKAITLVKNENEAFPIRMKPEEKTVILYSGSCEGLIGSGDLVRQMLEEKNTIPENAEISIMLNTEENGEECIQAATEANHVILLHQVYSAGDMKPDVRTSFSDAVFDKIIEKRHEENKTTIFVSCRLPYDSARFAAADAILLIYWASDMWDTPPVTGPGSNYSSNLPVGLLACFGEGKPQGTLPVDIPAMNRDYEMTGEIEWSGATK